MRKISLFLRPNCTKLILVVAIILLSLIITTGSRATSKVTWTANKGFPLPFIEISEHAQRKQCWTNTICVSTNIQKFYSYAFLLDLLVWYLVSCALTLAFTTVKEHYSQSKLE